MCAECNNVFTMAKRDRSDGGEPARKAMLQSMFHEGKAGEHRNIVFGPNAKQMPDETKLKHMEAAALHDEAADHFRSARWSFRDNLPKGAQEHLDLAAAPAEKANKLSEELGV
jgi:hypothetical protein